MDPGDWSVKSRLSVVYNEFGILEYYERHYLEAIEHLSTAVTYNPKIGPYYVSRARGRYMIEVSYNPKIGPYCVSRARGRYMIGDLQS